MIGKVGSVLCGFSQAENQCKPFQFQDRIATVVPKISAPKRPSCVEEGEVLEEARPKKSSNKGGTRSQRTVRAHQKGWEEGFLEGRAQSANAIEKQKVEISDKKLVIENQKLQIEHLASENRRLQAALDRAAVVPRNTASLYLSSLPKIPKKNV